MNKLIKNIILDVGGVFFDDKEKNVIATKNVGIKSFIFNSIEDIENNLIDK